MSRISTAAEIVRAVLVQAKLGDYPGIRQLPFDGKMQIFVGSMPDDSSLALALYDTAGVVQGRSMWNGRTLEHHGVKMILRWPDYSGAGIMRNLLAFFDQFKPTILCVNEVNCYIHSVYRKAAPSALGEEEGTRRLKWAVDLLVVYGDVETLPLEDD